MFEQMTGNDLTLALQRTGDAGEVDRIPVNDRTDNEIEAGGAKGSRRDLCWNWSARLWAT